MQKEQIKQDENIRFRILTEVSQQITSILEINDLLTRIVRLIQQTFGYYHVGIGLIEEDDVVYRVVSDGVGLDRGKVVADRLPGTGCAVGVVEPVNPAVIALEHRGQTPD